VWICTFAGPPELPVGFDTCGIGRNSAAPTDSTGDFEPDYPSFLFFAPTPFQFSDRTR
jgi:hypothetical protein